MEYIDKCPGGIAWYCLETFPPETNNIWFIRPDYRTVLVFVHGIHSDSRSSWLRENGRSGETVYWPRLIASDKDFSNLGVFLGGYSTRPDSAGYGLQDCAAKLFRGLNLRQDHASEPLMKAADNIIFLAHSMGGIVIRHMLVRETAAFRDKNVGLVLMASPSLGSYYADVLSVLIKLYKSDLARTLRTRSELLQQLDDDFGRMVQRKPDYIPNLFGAEACEHYFILRQTILHRMLGRFATKIPIFLPPVVDKHTAGRYWLLAERIADTDHFSIVKPRDRSSAPYSFLRSVLNRFQHEIPAAAWPKEIPIALPSRPNQAWIGTPAFFNDLRARVTQFEDIALYGRARMGKTFLAQHLIWDDDLRARFADGVLWGAVTNTRDFGSILIEWGAGAGLKRDTLLALSRVQDRVRAVANVVSNRRMLLVLDNCTSLADAELFKVIGSNSTRVLTTQSPEIAKEFSRGHAVEIQELDDNSIRQLLSGAQSPLVRQSPEAVNFLKVLSSSTEKLLTAAQLLQTLSDTEAKQLFALRREEPSR